MAPTLAPRGLPPAHAPTPCARLRAPLARPAAHSTRLTLARSLVEDGAALAEEAAAPDASMGASTSASTASFQPRTQPPLPPLPDWHPLSSPPLWSGGDESALGDAAHPSPLETLSPAWRLLLLSDGSVTRHLQLLTGAAVSVEVLDQRVLTSPAELAALPPSAREIAGPILQRRVLLRVAGKAEEEGAATGGSDATRPPALVFATSWWNVADAAATLSTTARPIWTSLASTRSELFREIRGVEHGGNESLAHAFRVTGGGMGDPATTTPPPLWGRHYLFHRGGRPLTAIWEVFSPRLGDWLGCGVGEEEG